MAMTTTPAQEPQPQPAARGALNALRDEALRIAVEHGFTDATVGEDIALMHSELSEALEAYREQRAITEVRYLEKGTHLEHTYNVFDPKTKAPEFKPVGVPSELADTIIRILHFCGKHKIDIDRAIREKMQFNETRPFKHGGKAL